ncbi:MAG: NAD+ synthase [Nitriliruptoraceae bacterium]
MRLALAQVAARVGDIDGNVRRILDAWRRAAGLGADLVVFTELTLTGYPPEDLLLKREFVDGNLLALERLADQGPPGTTAVVGHVGAGAGDRTDREHWDVALATRALTNSASVLAGGAVVATYDKHRLPNHGVFDEARYFLSSDEPCVVTVAGVSVGVVICEDLWIERGPVRDAVRAGAQVVAVLNASPFHRGKRAERERWVTHHATSSAAWIAWCNVVGGQDDVVFDGDSMVCDPSGTIVARGSQFAEDLVIVDVEPAGAGPTAVAGSVDTSTHRPAGGATSAPQGVDRLDPVGEVWHALVRATRDYCHRNGFLDAVIGLSGGIDSAVVAAVAVDALGADHVLGVGMPSRYSSGHSVDDARDLAERIGCRFELLPITDIVAAAGTTLDGLVATGFADSTTSSTGPGAGVAYENLQSRVRGLLLMALSNEHGSIVLTTGNKSEYAVGYATLYGDMAGGFAPLKDVPKTLVYELAHWRNREQEVIPTSTITKPPSAELRPGQVDLDSLPDYGVLDDIIAAYIEDDLGIDAIVERGHPRALVREILQMIDRAEYKRRQAAPGPKITTRAFGRDRRVPITSGWRG